VLCGFAGGFRRSELAGIKISDLNFSASGVVVTVRRSKTDQERVVARAGMKVNAICGHSLRAGCVTQAAMNGVREFVIMRQTGHRTEATLRRYIRTGEIFRENAAARLGI